MKGCVARPKDNIKSAPEKVIDVGETGRRRKLGRVRYEGDREKQGREADRAVLVIVRKRRRKLLR